MHSNLWKITIFGFVLVGLCLAYANGLADDRSKGKWEGLFEREPFVYTVPMVTAPSPVDGTYVKRAQKKGDIVPCRRCPDWLPNPGLWKINFKHGAYRIINTDTGWKSIGSYIVSGDRILFANDPACIHSLGIYRWQRKDSRLILEVIDDPCAIRLRAKNITEVNWHSCQPPNIEAAVTEHWPRPEGCD